MTWTTAALWGELVLRAIGVVTNVYLLWFWWRHHDCPYTPTRVFRRRQ